MRVLRLLFILFCAGIGFGHATGARYLIITHDSYAEALKPLADWKTQKGYKAKIVTLSEIGGSDSVSIRNYVVQAYGTWPIRPEYLLLVGNKNQIPFPFFVNTNYGQGYSDNYYTNVIGDYHNELIPGRFWVFDTNEVKTIVAKVLSYDKDPFMDDPSWFKKGSTVVCEDGTPSGDSIYWSDARYAHRLMETAGYLQIDSFAASFHDSSPDVIHAINEGRTYVLYRGLAGYDWCPPFGYIEGSDFDNRWKLPIVISASCATVEYIGYDWMNAGTADEPRGPVGFLATSTMLDNAAEFRSALALGTLRSIFSDSFSTLGRACEAGRQNYYNTFGNTLEYNSWTCLGDPEMTVRTETPRVVQVSHRPFIWIGDTLAVQVRRDSAPVENALVCVIARHDSALYHYGRTDNLGNIKFIDSLPYTDTAFITVTGRNMLTQTDTVIGGFQGGPCVKYIKHVVLDSVGGNGNYQPNNGENIELMVWVLNYGDSTAWGASGTLQKYETDAYYQLDDTVKFFGDLALLDSASTTADGFDLMISSICPDSHLIKLKLTVRDELDNSWISYFDFRVYCRRPYLVYASNRILDSLGGNNDHQVNPAEKIELPVWIKNIGDTLAENVLAWIQKSVPDQYFTIQDTIKDFGTILPLDSAWCGPDGYDIQVDSQCPDQHPLQLRIKIRDSLDSLWTNDFQLVNHAADLVFHTYYINDSVKYALPGDTFPISLFLKNIGSGFADRVSATLFTSDSFVTVIDGNSQFGSIPADSIGNNMANPFVVLARSNTPAGYSITMRAALTAGLYQDTISFIIYVGKRDYLVWDPDHNHSSGFILHQKLSNLHFLGNYRQTIPLEYLNLYKTLFISLGVTPNNQILYDTCAIIPEILHFMAGGGKLYMEGGNVWCHDTGYGGYNFCPLFYIQPVTDNSGGCSGIVGYNNTLTRGMSFKYTGESSSLDRITAIYDGVLIFKNRSSTATLGVAANHRTIGVSFEFAGLVDSVPPAMKSVLADSIMRYFGITPSGGINETESVVRSPDAFGLDLFPNPFHGALDIRYQFEPDLDIKGARIIIYDVTGRLIKEIPIRGSGASSDVLWSGDDAVGRKVPAGIYFIGLEVGEAFINKKIIRLR